MAREVLALGLARVLTRASHRHELHFLRKRGEEKAGESDALKGVSTCSRRKGSKRASEDDEEAPTEEQRRARYPYWRRE